MAPPSEMAMSCYVFITGLVVDFSRDLSSCSLAARPGKVKKWKPQKHCYIQSLLNAIAFVHTLPCPPMIFMATQIPFAAGFFWLHRPTDSELPSGNQKWQWKKSHVFPARNLQKSSSCTFDYCKVPPKYQIKMFLTPTEANISHHQSLLSEIICWILPYWYY